jgi:hypothetical protein
VTYRTRELLEGEAGEPRHGIARQDAVTLSDAPHGLGYGGQDETSILREKLMEGGGDSPRLRHCIKPDIITPKPSPARSAIITLIIPPLSP